MRRLAAGITIGLLAAAPAAADVIFDFESFAGNTDNHAGDHVALQVESGGIHAVIFRTSGERFTVWNSRGHNVPGSWGAKHLSPVFNYLIDDYMVMSFSAPMEQVTVEFGDYGDDDDLAELFAYDQINAGGTLLGSTSGNLGDNDMRWDDPTSLTFTAQPGEAIWSIRFRGGQDPFLQSTFIDNIVTKVVPTPGTLAVLGLACAAGAHRLRRRHTA